MNKEFVVGDFQNSIMKQKYALPTEKTWNDICKRVAGHLSKAENNGDMAVWEKRFNWIMANGYFFPGGRVLYGSGRRIGGLLNCFCKGVEDNRHSIAKLSHDMYLISTFGGGVGTNYSAIRPKGDPIQGVLGQAPGVVSEIRKIDAIGDQIKGGGDRKVALIATLSITHPDILDFLDVKLDREELTNHNISINYIGRFFDAVKDDEDWIFEFRGQKYNRYKMAGVLPTGEKREFHVVTMSEDNAIAMCKTYFKIDYMEEFEVLGVENFKARELWDRICENAVKSGEPGFLFEDNIKENFATGYFEEYSNCNPCVAGDTLIAVADGRDPVRISELADSGEDVEVYCADDDGNLCIELMENPRKTGTNNKIYRVSFSDGSYVDVNDKHKFILRDRTEKTCLELGKGDSISSMTKFKQKLWSKPRSQYYNWIASNGKTKAEHNVQVEVRGGIKVSGDECVHHIDHDASNNSINNLVVMNKKDHDKLHANLMFGDNNPVHRIENRDEWRKKLSERNSGENNPSSKGISNNDIVDLVCGVLLNNYDNPLSYGDFTRKLLEAGVPVHIKRGQYRGVSISDIIKMAIVKVYGVSLDKYRYVSYFMNKNYNTIAIDGKVFVKKNCEATGCEMVLPWERRHISYISLGAANSKTNSDTSKISKRVGSYNTAVSNRHDSLREKQSCIYNDLLVKLGRVPTKQEWLSECKNNNISQEISRASSPFKSWGELKNFASNINHRVVSVEEIGVQDVYCGTVRKHHNFFCIGNHSIDKNGNKKYAMVLTKNCTEALLPDNGNCNLGSINLSLMFDEEKNDVNWSLLSKVVGISVRMMDNVLTMNIYPTPDTKVVAERSRRIGLGVMGLHHLLIKMKLRYGSEESLEFIERLFTHIRNEAFKASIEIAKVKGVFPEYNYEKYISNEYVKNLPTRIIKAIGKHGIRNAVLLSIAPTGTISMVAGTSSGIEPIFSPMYNRKYRKGNVLATEVVVDKMFSEMVESGGWEHIVGAYDVTPEEHMAVQAAVQDYVDQAISKTINVPTDFDYKQLTEIVMNYSDRLKGLTIYRAGSRDNEPLEAIPTTEENVLKYAQKKELAGVVNSACSTGSCEI